MGSFGTASEDELLLTKKLFWGTFDSLSHKVQPETKTWFMILESCKTSYRFLYLLFFLLIISGSEVSGGTALCSSNLSVLHYKMFITQWCVPSWSFPPICCCYFLNILFSENVDFSAPKCASHERKKFSVVRGSEAKAQWRACEQCSWGRTKTDESCISLWQAIAWCRLLQLPAFHVASLHFSSHDFALLSLSI